MAPKKKSTTEKAPAKKTTRKRKPRAKKEEVVEVKEEDDFPNPMSLYGELFWEYRAKMAEYEKALLELNHAAEELRLEKSDPIYKKLLDLMAKDERLRSQLKQYADLLRGVQVKVAKHLDLDVQTFLKDCVVDHETGIVKIID